MAQLPSEQSISTEQTKNRQTKNILGCWENKRGSYLRVDTEYWDLNMFIPCSKPE